MYNFDLQKAMAEIDDYARTAYSKIPLPQKSKIFYRIEEWSGWRFYLKAIIHKDWDSIKYHLKNTYGKKAY